MKNIFINRKEGYPADVKIKEGWEVVNAPRPVPGQIAWQSTFRHGIYYAAGSREQFGKAWDSLDAWPCQLISNEEIIEQAREYCQRFNKTLETCRVPIEQIAKMMKLPYLAD